MWDLFKTLVKGAVIGLAIGLALDVYAELKKPKEERFVCQGRDERRA